MADIPVRNVRNALKSFVPNWLADVPGLNVGFASLFAIALACDMLIEVMQQGVAAAFPSKGTATADPYIGQSRGIIRGLLETDAQYEARLIKWLDLWENAGSAESYVQLVQTFLGNNLVIRLIDRSGNFVTANADGTTTKTVDATWNWDSALTYRSVPDPWWGDLWTVVYVTDGRWPTYSSLTDPAWIAAWGTYQKFGAGHEVTRDVVDGIYTILAQWKGAHTWMEALIFTTDTSLFVPGSLGGIPDGHFGNWSKTDGSNRQVPARTIVTGGGTVRYWIPTYGG